jgi:DNA-binding PadR family transcriptional regulator
MLAIADGERHGYSIGKEVEAQTAGAVKLGPATLYRTIKQLVTDGWIAEIARERGPESDDERRRYYRLTPHGRRVAEAEAQRLADLVFVARARRLLPAGALV